jgi:predicted nucleic acid-binding protein
MKTFVDTSALLAILDPDDPNHDAATEMFRAALQADEAFTHNYVHVEAEQLIRRRRGAEAAAKLLKDVLPVLRTVWVNEEIHREAVEALGGKGRAASLVDQVSFAVMRRLGVATAIAFDADFDRQGFRRPETRRRHALSDSAGPYGTSTEGSDLVSVAEVSSRSGRSVNTIQSWRRRHADFPAPRVELAAGPIWRWDDVSAWIGQRSRRPNAGAPQ